MTAMTPRLLARKIRKLRVTAPITASYGHALVVGGIWNDEGVWYTSQKEHWLGWLSEYDGPGAYGRKRWMGRSAEFVYNHINCPPMVVMACGSSRGVKVGGSPRQAFRALRPAQPRHPLRADTKVHSLDCSRGAALGESPLRRSGP
jgi:hypothetical protein